MLAGVAGAGCRDPRADFDDYLARTRSDAGGDDTTVPSQFEDLNGTWLCHALLAGGLDLGLRIQIAMDVSQKPIPLHARMWLAKSDPATTPPLVETDTVVGKDGTFVLTADPLLLGPGALKLDTTVSASVVMAASTQSADAWCGSATGTVDKPLMLDLAGSTFAARRDDGKLTVAEVPSGCAPRAASDGGVAEVPRPLAPDLSSVPSVLADLSGHFILDARLAGSLPLSLWASLTFVAAPGGGGSLDGALRRATDPLGSPALATFTTTVSPDGRFAVWLPHLAVGATQASVLLVAATESGDRFCGAGAGRVQKPIMLDLAGTTFAALRWQPGAPLPKTKAVRCP